MARRNWSVQDAKNRFSEVVEAARRAPQTVTKHGKPTIVVVDVAEYERLRGLERARAPSFAEILLAMPQDDGEFPRRTFRMRDPDLPLGMLFGRPLHTFPDHAPMFLIDTVTLSELRRRERDPLLVKWFERQRAADLFLSVVSVGEIERDIARQSTTNPRFATALAEWLDRVLTLYGERIVPFDLRAARRWGALSAALGNDSADLMIAATALENGFTVVTRNVSNFEPTGVTVVDPFAPRPPGKR